MGQYNEQDKHFTILSKTAGETKHRAFGFIKGTYNIADFINVLNRDVCLFVDNPKLQHKNTQGCKILPYIKLDIDVPGLWSSDEIPMHVVVEQLLKKNKITYIKKPSTRNNIFDYKWHFIVPIDASPEEMDGAHEDYKILYRTFLKLLLYPNVSTSKTFTKSDFSKIFDMALEVSNQLMSPYMHGLDVPAAIVKTTYFDAQETGGGFYKPKKHMNRIAKDRQKKLLKQINQQSVLVSASFVSQKLTIDQVLNDPRVRGFIAKLGPGNHDENLYIIIGFALRGGLSNQEIYQLVNRLPIPNNFKNTTLIDNKIKRQK